MNITPPGSARDIVRSRALLADRRFASLWLSQGLAQTAQNAMLWSLLVIILEITGSSVHTSLLLLSLTLPSIPLGVVVGVVLDRVSKGPVLVITNLIRAGACLLFLLFHSNEWGIYGIALGFSTAGLFFNPAVVSLIPSLVSRDRLVSANSLYNFTLTASQLVGIVFLAPLLLKSIHADGIFIAAMLMFLAAAAFAWRLRDVAGEENPEGPAKVGSMHLEFRESWRVIVADRYASLALGQLILSSTLVLLFAVLIPRYMQDVVDLPPENSAFVFAPTGIGALVGLRFLPWFTKRGKNRTVMIGLIGIAASLALLALVNPIADIWQKTPGADHLIRGSVFQTLTMLFAGPMGFFYALLNAPAQTVLHERAPPHMRGRIFATQVILANFISLFPLILFGAAADLLNVTIVLLMVALGLVGMAALSRAVGGPEDEELGAGEPGTGPEREERKRAPVSPEAPASIDTPRGVR